MFCFEALKKKHKKRSFFFYQEFVIDRHIDFENVSVDNVDELLLAVTNEIKCAEF